MCKWIAERLGKQEPGPIYFRILVNSSNRKREKGDKSNQKTKIFTIRPVNVTVR